MRISRAFSAILLLLSVADATAQMAVRTISRDEYIQQWKDVAIMHKNQYGIPASITLAQGIFESGNGNSALARYGNNHFGIKCHTDWKGETMHANDDAPNECFRKYKSAEESFEDHAAFLKKNSRYHFLFDYAADDYVNWAHGLKKAGYATSATYTTALIKLIEENNLQRFDKGNNDTPMAAVMGSITRPATVTHPVRVHNNNIKYVVVAKGDTYFKIATEFDMRLWQLYKYNDIAEDAVLKPGDIVYLQPKRNRNKSVSEHTVKAGETLQSISQQYGVKLKKLEKRNDIKADDVLKPGSKIDLGGK
jgi:LysM repeat protein